MIDGEGVRKGIKADNGDTGTPVFRNLLIQNCHGSYGGGCHISIASPRFEQCWFADNTAVEDGGAVHMGHTSASFIGCVFVRNHADRGGAVMASSECDPLFEGCSFGLSTDSASGNTADGTGGAMFLDYGLDSPPCVVTDCDFFSNYAATGGGAIRLYREDAILTGCRFGLEGSPTTGNTTSTPVYAGGAITANDGSLQLTDCQFHHGDSWYGGGVYVNDCHESLGHSVTIQSCRFTNNDAATGGGFAGHDSTIAINDTDFEANNSTASNGAGGAIYVRSWPDQALPSELTMTECTFTRNHAENTGGGIWSYQVDLNLDSCIFGDPTDATAGNTTLGYGGAIRFFNDPDDSYSTTQNFTASIRGGGFYDNHANLRGGAFYYAGMPLTIEQADDGGPCIFRSNTTGAGTNDIAESDRGGAISIDDDGFADEHDLGDGPILSVTGAIFENNSTEDQWGGALYLHDVETEFADCTFTGNNATIGGAIRCYRKTTMLTNCDFTGNHARINLDGTWGFGGAISSDESSIHATNCTFSANDAQAGSGGGVYLTETDHSFTDCDFQSNSAYVSGGAVYLDQSTAQFLDCVVGSLDDPVDGNIANSELGGGLFLIRSLVEMTNCVIANNVATNSTGCAYGGGFFAQDCLAADGRGLTLLDCMVEENQACLGGGAFLDGVVMTATNTTFVQNAAIGSDGSAINGSLLGTDGAPTEITLTDCTVTGNQSTGTHAIYLASGNWAVIAHSTICDNTDTTGTPQDPIHGSWTDLGNNCISLACDSDGDETYDCNDLCQGHSDAVDTDQDGIPDGCDSDTIWQVTPEDDLQAVIDGAIEGQTIQMAAGTYQGPVVIQTPGLSLEAGGSVQISGSVASWTVQLDTPPSGAMVLLQGIDIQGTLGVGAGTWSGGVRIESGTMSMVDCSIYDCSAEQGAGAYVAADGTLLLTGCDVFDNVASVEGGGTYVEADGLLDMFASVICANTPDQVSGTYTADESTCITESCTDDDLDGIPDDCQKPDCPADFNGDGAVTAADITTLLQAWATAAGDLNGDGTTSAADITVLLQSWGSCRG